MKSVALRRAVLVSIAIAAACAEDEAQWSVRFAPEFPKTPARVSVVGVFRDGRMNAETWDELGVRLSSPFGSGACPIAYDPDLLAKHEDLANAVDDYARANGVTDGLLDKLAPAASGDEVLVFTVAGHPRVTGSDAGVPSSAPMSAPMSGRSAGGRGRGSGMGMQPMRMPEKSAFEVSASLFSPRDHHSVGLIAMEYSGSSATEALTRFAEKVRAALPGATCVGWHWDDAHIDEKAIRDLKEDE